MTAELWWAVIWDDNGDMIFVFDSKKRAKGMVRVGGPQSLHVEQVSVIRDGGKLAKETE
jgi:hypothetical protein